VNLPGSVDTAKGTNAAEREIVFISKATPEDDEFVLWLAPRLEAAGYKVFADILTLEPGDRWRREITNTLQKKAVKLLLCCRDATLNKSGVQEEIGIASDLVKELNDQRFIIPLRLEPFKKLFGIGELQWVEFVGSWASGLHDLLDTLEKQNVPRTAGGAVINPNWENYRKRLAMKVEKSPEILTSNWLRIIRLPDTIRYYYPPGPINLDLMDNTCRGSTVPAEVYHRGFFSFALPQEIERDFADVAPFEIQSEHKLLDLVEHGSQSPDLKPREAKNILSAMFRRAWENFCRSKGLYEHLFSTQTAFHIGEAQTPLGKRISWGRDSQRRSSMLRNSAGGKVCQYGVSATPFFWPFPHFKLKARVLFADLAASNRAGAVINDTGIQHRLRRSICKGWRNKAWHGRLMAFLELLSSDSPCIEVPLSGACAITFDARPMPLTSPVTTALPDTMEDDAEEPDDSTLGMFNPEDEE
jgi:TIR domain